MRYPNVIAAVRAGTFLAVVWIGSTAAAQSRLEKTIDSLFIIASAGEVKFREMVQPAKDSIAAYGAEAVPVLVEKFATFSAREKWTVHDILRQIDSAAVPYLNNALNRDDGRIVQRICYTLGEIGDTSSVGPLLRVTDHERWQVREQAVGALGRIGDERAGPTVLAALDDSVGQVRKAAAVSLGKLEFGDGIRSLAHAMGDGFYGARMSAAEALLTFDTALVVAAVADSLESSNRLVGNLGCFVLGKLATDEAIELLLGQSRSADPLRRAHAGVALVTADPHDNCGYHRFLLINESDRFVRLKIESAIASSGHVP